MSSITCTAQTDSMAVARVRACPRCGIARGHLLSLLVVLMMALAGCATPHRIPDPVPPPVPESTWRQVDSDIATASLAAVGPARNYARGFMESWRSLVSQRTEADFIPWFTGYWTQQWLAIKVAWYKLSIGEGTDPAVGRLAAYLQEQYKDRVLDPVARDIDPDVIRARTTALYVKLLGEQLQGIPRRYGLPLDQYDRRLKDIPAIAVAPPAAHRASLYELVHAEPISGLPAYVALTARLRNAAGGAGAGPSTASISPVAKRASEKLVARLAASSGASAAAAAVGGVAGVVISLGAIGFGAIAHEKERPEMEAQLRQNLNAALDETWHSLMEDPFTGVMAGVHHISQQVHGSLLKAHAQPVETITQAVELQALPRDLPLPGEESLQNEETDDETLADEHADE